MQPFSSSVKRKELFHVAGDAPDPAPTGLRGMSTGYDLRHNALGHPHLHYQYPSGETLVFEADVFGGIPGVPRYILLHCPQCLTHGRQNTLTIREDFKPFAYDPSAVAPPFPGWTRSDMASAFPLGTGGLLNLEVECACTWEEEPDLRRAHFSRCPMRFRIINNRICDA